MHGGTVEARSDGPGQGSEFVVRLPVAGAGRPRPRPPAATASDGRRAGSRRRILVVDDNRGRGRQPGACCCELMGHEVRTAHDGAEAVRGGGGVPARRGPARHRPAGAERLRGLPAASGEQPWGEDVVIVALTGWGQEEDRRRSREAGFDHHLVKPVEPAALEKLLAALPPQGGLSRLVVGSPS